MSEISSVTTKEEEDTKGGGEGENPTALQYDVIFAQVKLHLPLLTLYYR